jgi:glycosyltransferase involved in cell wall biosynthesis
MILALDLRFYSLQKYGISVHIKNLMLELAFLLKNDAKLTRVYLILNKSLQNQQNSELAWLKELEQSPKFKPVYTTSKHYSLSEQINFLFLLNALKADLVYFFTFNFPVFYQKKFLYQVLDLTNFKIINTTKASFLFKLKSIIAKFIMKQGLKKASKILLLGKQTELDIKTLLNFDLQNTDYKIIFNGISKDYINFDTSNFERYTNFKTETNLKFKFSTKEKNIWQKFKTQNAISKPYFLFVSNLKKHKNLDLLIDVFEKIQTKKDNKFQLVVVGGIDPKNTQSIEKMQNSTQFKIQNIIHLKNLQDQEVIRLQDNCLAYIMPSLSEGFGLTIAEAASRFSPVICSDILVFKEILKQNAFYFDPNSEENMLKAIELFLAMTEINPKELKNRTLKANLEIQKFNWKAVADDVYQSLSQVLKND